LNKVKPWILASRPKTLFAALAPIIVGLSISFNIFDKQIDWIVALMTISAALLIQVGSNYANDAYDYLKGADSQKTRKGPMRMAQEGILSPDAILTMMYFIFLISVLIGFYLALVGGWPIVVIGLSSIVFAIIYTGGPFPLGYNGLGDISVFIFFGIIATAGTVYLQSEALSSVNNIFYYTDHILLAAIAIGCLNTAILVVNNLRDYESDKLSNKKTLVVIFGQRFGCFQYSALLLISIFSFISLGLLIGNYWISLVMSFNFIMSFSLIKKIFNYQSLNLNKMLEKTSQFAFLNSLMFAISICISIL